jgi:hypothetical protein
MKLRYEQLFGISLTSSYYSDSKTHEDLSVEPTGFCKRQMSRFKILSRKTFNGMALLYECSPVANDASAFKPISSEEKFTFKVKASNTDFWFYADVREWESGKIFLLKNPTYAATGNINIVTGALLSPIIFRPMEFKYDVALESTEGLLEIHSSTGTLIKSIIIRAKSPEEATGVKEQYIIGLKNYPEGSYTLRRITSGGTFNEQVFCSADYSADTLAVIEITYKGDAAWTGQKPYQNYIVRIDSRQADWFFDIHIRKKAVPAVTASKLAINHANVPPDPKNTLRLKACPMMPMVLSSSNR